MTIQNSELKSQNHLDFSSNIDFFFHDNDLSNSFDFLIL